MVDEPSPGELFRRLNDVSGALQRSITQELFVAEQRANERRFIDLERDIDDLQRRHDDDLRTLTARLDARDRERGSNWRQGVYAGIIPSALLLISLLVQIWLSAKGGGGP